MSLHLHNDAVVVSIGVYGWHGYLWVYGCRWVAGRIRVYVGFYGCLWVSECLWVSISVYGYLWVFVGFWVMGIYESMGVTGISE